MKDKLKSICNWLNENYNQESENYSIFAGPKPDVIKYDEHAVISLWACGAIVCVNDLLFFIEEDDGYWFIEENKEYGAECAYQGCFSIAWADSFINAMKNLKEYVYTHGTPVYFSGTDTICHYTL